MDAIEFGRRLRAAREKAGLSQTEAAERLGWKIPSYTQYERGVREPGILLVWKLVDVLELSPRLLVPEWFAARKRSAKP